MYPAAMFLYASACLLSQRMYLFPVLGSVHVRNLFRFTKPLAPKEHYRVGPAGIGG